MEKIKEIIRFGDQVIDGNIALILILKACMWYELFRSKTRTNDGFL